MFIRDLNNLFTMDTEAIVIRIKTPSGDMDSSVDCPSLLNFSDLLVAIRDVMPEATVTAFEYEDEVGDRITVRSDEELKAMLSYVNTRPNPANDCTHAVPDSMANNSLKKSSAELKRILTNGQINAQDIHYQEQLGHGNGGTVYKAYHIHGKRVLAVKVIPLDITVELQKQIMSELEILYKVVKGLTYLWSLKILHRDVKPSNMLVNTRGQVKLCDFGVSTQVLICLCEHWVDTEREREREGGVKMQERRRKTILVNSIAKTYVGTNAYMAPERISGEQYGIHADVWSVGISFMEVQQCSHGVVLYLGDILALGMFPYPQTLHLQAVAEWCGESARIQLVRRSQPKSSGLSCHFCRRWHSCLCKNPLLHFTENILVQTEGEVGGDERERERDEGKQ
ncbi:hypothetical protein INR49_028852 [Caranx melampygus]|nr:hypothetical protein INR49_028852 [Caranx melampygus]